jgi:hypothetical protein
MFHANANAQTDTPTTVMTPSHPRWPEFVDQLRNHPARCQHEHLFSIAILAAMGGIDVMRSLKFFEECGVRCDCELVAGLGAADGNGGTPVTAQPCLDRQCPEAILRTVTAQLRQLRRDAGDPSAIAGADVTHGIYPDRDGEDAELSRTQQGLAVAITDLMAVAAAQRVQVRATVASAPGTVMNPDHPRWAEFIAQLNGPAGLAEAECQDDYRCSERILGAMGGINIPASLAFFNTDFGCCDCEVLCNLGEPLLLSSPDSEVDDPVDATDLTCCA